MAYTNETTHYSIPLPLGSDLTTPMDYNTAMQTVDTALFESKTDSSSALQKANQLQQDLATTNDNVTAVTGRVTTLEGTTTTQGQAIIQNKQDIADVRADALDMIVAKDEGTAQVATVAVSEGQYFRYNDVLYLATKNIAIGDTIVPNENCKATNVGTELTQLKSDLDGVDEQLYPKLLVRSSTTGTYAQKILELKSAFLNMNYNHRYRAYIVVNGKSFVCENNTGISFTNVETSVPTHAATINKIDLIAGIMETVKISSNNITFTDVSSTSDSFDFALFG